MAPGTLRPWTASWSTGLPLKTCNTCCSGWLTPYLRKGFINRFLVVSISSGKNFSLKPNEDTSSFVHSVLQQAWMLLRPPRPASQGLRNWAVPIPHWSRQLPQQRAVSMRRERGPESCGHHGASTLELALGCCLAHHPIFCGAGLPILHTVGQVPLVYGHPGIGGGFVPSLGSSHKSQQQPSLSCADHSHLQMSPPVL